jgi:hypothetical protein
MYTVRFLRHGSVVFLQQVVARTDSFSLVVQCDAFRSILRDEFDMPCTIRQEKGSDIAGACGQLAIDHKSSNLKGILDIEEVAARLLAV